MRINFVISKDLGSRIFCDIFRRYVNYGGIDVTISEAPIPDADIYHYHRVHLEEKVAGPWVATVHHDPIDIDPWLGNEKFYNHYRSADCVVCLNSLQVTELRRHHISKTEIIPHGYDAKLFSKKPVAQFDKKRKIVIGIISKRYKRRFKGEVLMYDLMHQLPADRFSFLFVGEGRLQDAAYASKLGFDVRCYEFMPYRLFSRVYRDMDFLLMVSNFEGGPANLPEAIASGTPILATNVGMVPDLIVNGRNGIVLTGRPEEDGPTIASIATNKNAIFDRLMAGANALNTAISWEQVIEKHLDLYSRITGLPVPQRPDAPLVGISTAPAAAEETEAETGDDAETTAAPAEAAEATAATEGSAEPDTTLTGSPTPPAAVA